MMLKSACMNSLKRLLVRVFSALLVLSIFYFLGNEVIKNWEQISAFEFHFNIPFLLLSCVTYATAFGAFGLGWALLLRCMGCHIPLGKNLLYFFISQPAKYIPGKIWLAVARLKYCSEHGVSKSIAVLSTFFEAEMEVFAGAYITLFTLMQSELLGAHAKIGLYVLAACGVVFLIPRVLYFFINLYLKVLKHEPVPQEKHADFKTLFGLQLIYIIGMGLLGISHLLFLKSFVDIPAAGATFIISVTVFSYIAGIVAIFTPSGLGVREGVWFLALKNLAGPHTALIFSFISRLWTIVVEVILAAGSLIFLAHQKRKSAGVKRKVSEQL